MSRIRNFSIIAHIDHGKSTLADRLIQHAHVVADRDFHDQMLDNMDIERERGITIKSQTVSLPYTSLAGDKYLLNLIDTPGHVDFSYEVSRALQSCEGVLLLIDASQGVQAQTLANLYTAMENNLTVIPVINKIDLLSANIEAVKEEIENELALDPDDAILASAKEGKGIVEILEAVVARIPAPKGSAAEPLAALIFDAKFDPFRGTIVSMRVIDGTVKPGDIIRLWSTGKTYKVEEVGYFRITRQSRPFLEAGEVGYLVAGIKTVGDTRVGDTITQDDRPCPAALPGFTLAKPVVFSSLYPVAADDFRSLADALDKYVLNDASFTYQKDSSAALGQGFRCGFLGLLHLEIVQERLEREYDQSLIMTVPSVEYHVKGVDGKDLIIDNPAYWPDPTRIAEVQEPYIKAKVMMPERYMGVVMKVVMSRRAESVQTSYPTPGRIELVAEMPLAEVLFDFYDRLKSVTQGYGSFDYELIEYRPADVVKVDILVNSEKVDALSFIVHRENARPRALHACERLEDEIPRQQFKIAIQGAIGGSIIARTTINPFRKDVTAKCYGGDISRKRKLLEKQKEGKKRMKVVGNVEIPQSAFVAVLKTNDE